MPKRLTGFDPDEDFEDAHLDIDAIHEALRFLAERCDRATTTDGKGFSKKDWRFGHSLAERAFLTVAQARAGKKMLRKISPADTRRAVGPDLSLMSAMTTPRPIPVAGTGESALPDGRRSPRDETGLGRAQKPAVLGLSKLSRDRN